jgi:hypothetical protein
MKKAIYLIGIILLTSLVFMSCNNSGTEEDIVGNTSYPDPYQNNSVTEEDLVGKTFDLDSYHRIEFKSSQRYHIYQRPLNCGGDGNWSILDGKIVLGLNDSQCESTREINGTYEYSQFN